MWLIDFCKKILNDYREPIAYVFFGGLTTLVTWATYALFVHLGIEINISNILSWICGVSFAFVVNKWFVFLSKDTTAKTIGRELTMFFGARIITGVIAIVLFPILYSAGLNQTIFNTDGMLAKIVTSCIEIILNWFFSKYYIFKPKWLEAN